MAGSGQAEGRQSNHSRPLQDGVYQHQSPHTCIQTQLKAVRTSAFPRDMCRTSHWTLWLPLQRPKNQLTSHAVLQGPVDAPCGEHIWSEHARQLARIVRGKHSCAFVGAAAKRANPVGLPRCRADLECRKPHGRFTASSEHQLLLSALQLCSSIAASRQTF